MNDFKLPDESLITNPNARVPIILALDTSGSMDGAPISELNKGVSAFFDAIRNDEVAAMSAEIAIVTFGHQAETLVDFDSIETQRVPRLSASGATPMGSAVNIGLDKLETRKNEYKNAGVDYYQPWLVLMTDGEPTDSIESAVQRTVSLLQSKKLTIFPIAIGEDANLDTLARFSPFRPPLRLKGLNFKEFFEWLSASVSTTSRSSPGDKIELDLEGIKAWGTL